MRRARDLACIGLLLCASCLQADGERCTPNAICVATQPPSVTGPAGRDVPFRDEGATTSSAHEGAAAIDAVHVGSGLRITAYQGSQRSGGHAIRVERITRAGDELRVHSRFVTPSPDAIVTMALTSPAHTVSVGEAASVVVLLDIDGVERARTSPR